ncbi:DUF6236 family protein, partial [Methylobacterium sp. GC_Met_2]|uniref:DUF6236 family protein n=1 Tax=Methylobacterium sp. GC_Met_2 TaxID=2937376 RepID=UPI00226B71DD
RREPGVWSLAQGENSFLLKEGAAIQAGNAQLHLTNAIPVPNHDVPLAEVLEFKIRRRDELQLLRREIDTLIASMDDAADKQQELKRLVKNVDGACADAIRVANEWQFPVRLTNFKSTYKVRPFQTLAGIMTGVFGSQATELTQSHTALAGLAGAAIATAPAFELTFDGLEWRGLRPRQGPYRYVYEFHRELF